MGVPIGDDDACAATLLEMLQTRLKQPLENVGRMHDTSNVRHAVQLAVNLLRVVAQLVPAYWMACMPPRQTEDAASWADAAIHAALHSVLRFGDSPQHRAALAALAASMPVRIGGLGFVSFSTGRDAAYSAAFLAAWPTCCALDGGIADIAVAADSPAPSVASFATAWEGLTALLASVRERHALLDADTRVWVDGSIHSAYHPHLDSRLTLPPLTELFDSAPSTLTRRFSRRQLSAVVNGDVWLRCIGEHGRFDVRHGGADAVVRDREAARLISCSLEGAGAWVTRLPDPSVKFSVVASAEFRTMAQRRLGLFLSELAPALDAAAAAGKCVVAHDRLGDAAINAANHSNRHAAGLRAVYTAFTALSVANTVPGHFKLGDRGDGTAAGKLTARQRYAHINDGHVPDFIHFLARPHCYEFKCYSPFPARTSAALGHGSARCGGAASQADGGRYAMGSTEEHLIVEVVGVPERGAFDDGPHKREGPAAGSGWVRATTTHQYADAQQRGNPVTLLVTETTGAQSHTLCTSLREMGKAARAPGTHDSTCYGTARTSPSAFYAHHLAAISHAIVAADAILVLHAAAAMSFKLSVGIMP